MRFCSGDPSASIAPNIEPGVESKQIDWALALLPYQHELTSIVCQHQLDSKQGRPLGVDDDSIIVGPS